MELQTGCGLGRKSVGFEHAGVICLAEFDLPQKVVPVVDAFQQVSLHQAHILQAGQLRLAQTVGASGLLLAEHPDVDNAVL